MIHHLLNSFTLSDEDHPPVAPVPPPTPREAMPPARAADPSGVSRRVLFRSRPLAHWWATSPADLPLEDAAPPVIVDAPAATGEQP